MFIVTKVRPIKKRNGSQILEQKEGIDYQTILVFDTEEEALEVATKKLRENPHGIYLIFVQSHILKTREAPLEITNILDGTVS